MNFHFFMVVAALIVMNGFCADAAEYTIRETPLGPLTLEESRECCVSDDYKHYANLSASKDIDDKTKLFLDGKQISAYYQILFHNSWEEPNGRQVHFDDYTTLTFTSLVFSRDSKHLAYQARNSAFGKFFVVLDGKEHPDHQIIEHLIFCQDDLYYEVWHGDDKRELFLNDGSLGIYDRLYDMRLSKNGQRFSCAACKDGICFSILNGVQGAQYKSIGASVFSANDKHVALCSRKGR